MSLEQLKTALVSVLQKVYRYKAPPNTSAPYAVWGEDSRNDFIAGGKHAEKAWQGTLDYYTKVENDPVVTELEDVLEKNTMTWYFSSIQYEEETGLIHFEWVWELG